MSVAEAMEAFLPALDEDQANLSTPKELRLYLHAQDHRLLTRDMLGYPSLFGDIIQGLACQFDYSCPVAARELLHMTV